MTNRPRTRPTAFPPSLARNLSATAILLAACGGAACGGDQPPGNHEPLVDTLRSGTVVVRNSAQGLWDLDPGARWTVVEGLRIGSSDGPGPDVFGSVPTLIVDDLHRIWVVDAMANELRVFDSDGRHVRTVGRPGEGPSEFRRIGPVFHGPDATIWVEDLSLARWEVFDTAGVRVEGHPAPTNLRGGMRHWTRGGLLLVLAPNPESPPPIGLVAYRRTRDGELEREGRVFELPREPRPVGLVTVETERFSTQVPAPFVPESFGVFGPGLDYWFSDGRTRRGSYEIHRIGLDDGATRLTIRRRFTPTPIPDSIRAAAIEAMRQDFREQGMPTEALTPGIVPREYPPLNDFFLSADGTLWVRRVFADGVVGFDVFAADGRLLGRPDMNAEVAGLRIVSITGTSIYGIDTDELGVDRVVRLDVDRTRVAVQDSAGVLISENNDSGGGVVWTIRDEPVLTIGADLQAPAEYQFESIGDVIRLPDGGVLVADLGDNTLRAYREDGTYAATWGREGEGPGDFSFLGGVDRLGADSVVAWDRRLLRLTVFDMTGGVGRLTSVREAPELVLRGAIGPDRLVFERVVEFEFTSSELMDILAGRGGQEEYQREQGWLEVRDATGGPVAEVGPFPNTEYHFPTPDTRFFGPLRYSRSTVTGVWGSLAIAGPNDTYELRAHAADGGLARIIRLNRAPVATDGSHRRAFAEANPDRDPDVPMASHLPMFGAVMEDALGHLWVRDYDMPGEDTIGWTVFDSEGFLVTRLTTSDRLTIREIGRDHVLGTRTDELGVQSVVVLVLDRG